MTQRSKYRYLLYGWNVESELMIPGLPETAGNPDILITLGIPELHQPETESFYSFTIGGIGDFHVSSCEIFINPIGARESVLPYLLGTAFGALIHKRNMLVLHGSSVIVGNSAVIFSGSSGSGKSTLSAAFIRQGYKLVSDDVCIISVEGLVHPSYPHLRLWSDSSETIDLKITDKFKSEKENKFSFAVPDNFYSSAMPLKCIYLLHRGSSDLEIREINGAEKFKELAAQTYRPGFIAKMNRKKDHFEQISDLAEKIKVFILHYPSDFNKIEHVTKLIKTHVYEFN